VKGSSQRAKEQLLIVIDIWRYCITAVSGLVLKSPAITHLQSLASCLIYARALLEYVIFIM